MHSLQSFGRLAACCLLLAGLTLPQNGGAADATVRIPPALDVANGNALALLSSARDALGQLANPASDDRADQLTIYFAAAAESLTGLYQLHGCQWAAPELRRLYARQAAPSLRLGYSADGRVLLRVEPLDLKNPAFKNYTVLLCTLNSETARDLTDSGAGALVVTPQRGAALKAQVINEQHPLWKQLSRQVDHFRPITGLPSGAGIAFKQLYAVPAGSLALNTCAVSLNWGGYQFALPRWTSAPQ